MSESTAPAGQKATADPAKLAKYVHAKPDDAYLRECAEEAADLVTDRIRGATRQIPAGVLARATREVGAELFHRRSSRNGIVGLEGGMDFAPMRIARDPMKAAEPFLVPYLPPVIG